MPRSMEISEEVTLHITTEAVEQEEIPVVASKKDAQLCPIDSLDSARDDNTDNNKGYDVRVDHQSSFSSLRKTIKHSCYPHSMGLHEHLPLGLSLLAIAMTGYSSWDCHFFKGANILFISPNYGLWTVEDGFGKCQLWNVLFFSYDLGAPLMAARFLSMFSMIQGLAVTTVIAQSLQLHIVSWGVGFCLTTLFLVSLSTTSIFNMWTFFFLFSYMILTLIVRFTFAHPVPRMISDRGTKMVVFTLLACATYCLLLLVVLMSDFCTCSNISSQKLQGRDAGDPCDSVCHLGPAGHVMIAASFVWMVAAASVFKFGIQPHKSLFENSTNSQYAHYSRESIRTRVVRVGGRFKKRTHAALSVMSRNTRNLQRYWTRKDSSLDPIPSNKRSTPEEISSSEAVEMAQINDDNTGDNENRMVDESLDNRSICSKWCCDYRITPRTASEKCFFWSFRAILGMLIVIYVFFVFLQIGSLEESTQAAKAPSTAHYFTTPQVCAFDAEDPSKPFETFPNRQAAVAANYTVAHCGSCGYCSNPQDIRTYVETRKTIAMTARKCGMKATIGSYAGLVKCLEQRIGFSPRCTECWADNMISTSDNCLFACISTMFTGFMASNNVADGGNTAWLNQCLYCDEKISGPAFVTCSGVARRRLGIASEIERNPQEQCTRMDIDWVEVDWQKEFPGTVGSTELTS